MPELTRKVGDEILIGDDITLYVLSVNGSYVRLGIAAPGNVSIMREELLRTPKSAQPTEDDH